MLTPELIVTEAKKLIGVPFRNYGRSRLGLDCAGLIYYVLTKLGKDIPKSDGSDYPITWWRNKKSDKERLVDYLINQCSFELVDKPCIGGLVTFRMYFKTCKINHCGILINDDSFIHASCDNRMNRKGIIISNFRDNKEFKNIVYYLKHKECE